MLKQTWKEKYLPPHPRQNKHKKQNSNPVLGKLRFVFLDLLLCQNVNALGTLQGPGTEVRSCESIKGCDVRRERETERKKKLQLRKVKEQRDDFLGVDSPLQQRSKATRKITITTTSVSVSTGWLSVTGPPSLPSSPGRHRRHTHTRDAVVQTHCVSSESEVSLKSAAPPAGWWKDQDEKLYIFLP